MSAAHCIVNIDALAIRTKPHRLDDPLDDSEIFAVKEAVSPPNFGLVTGIDQDFWLLKLDGQSSNPLLRLNSNPYLPTLYDSLTVAGWGTIWPGSNLPPEVLQFTNHSIYISNDECVGVTVGGPKGEYNGTFSTTVTDDMMCAWESGRGSCQGDSGTLLY